METVFLPPAQRQPAAASFLRINGIDETKRIQEEATAKRQEDAKRLTAIQEEYIQRMH
jgi:hypothetical protein